MNFKVDDEVYLKSDSRFFGTTHNPASEKIKGVVVRILNDDLQAKKWMLVRWDADIIANAYNDTDLGLWAWRQRHYKIEVNM